MAFSKSKEFLLYRKTPALATLARLGHRAADATDFIRDALNRWRRGHPAGSFGLHPAAHPSAVWGPIFNRRQDREVLHTHNARAQAPSFVGHLLSIPKHDERPIPTEHTDAALPSSTLALREVDF